MSATQTDARMRFESALKHGIRAVAVALLFVYCVAAPSNDVRARIPFLVLLTPITLFVSWIISALAALVAVVSVERISRQAVAGAAVAATLGHMFVLSGVVVRVMPEIGRRSTGWIACSLGLSVFLGALVRTRNRSRRVSAPD